MNVAVGWFVLSASKKSAERRCPSRCSTPVLSEATPTVKLPVELAGFSSSSVIVPSTSANLPRTVVTIMCLAENRTSVCAGSMFQVVTVIGVRSSQTEGGGCTACS